MPYKRRNEPCACGSGLKYKYCCWPLDDALDVRSSSSICLFVGNGLTKDLAACCLQGEAPVDPSRPLALFAANAQLYDWFVDRLPDVRQLLQSRDWMLHDNFEAIRAYYADYAEDVRIKCQLRRFLALAYTELQLLLERKSYREWRWTRWLSSNSRQIRGAVSLNYDLVLEGALSDAQIQHHRVAASNEYGGIPVIKPHGSIDFDVEFAVGKTERRVFLRVQNIEQIWTTFTEMNDDDGKVCALARADWRIPRVEADIVPPGIVTEQTQLRWVREGYEAFRRLVATVDSLVIVGFSFGPSDRDEFRAMMRCVRGRALPVHIIDPEPRLELVEFLRDNGNVPKPHPYV